MNRQCEFIMGAQGDGNGNPKVLLCETPASIKRNGRWLCAEHYDDVESDGTSLVSPTLRNFQRLLD